jgi:hypothetical protein
MGIPSTSVHDVLCRFCLVFLNVVLILRDFERHVCKCAFVVKSNRQEGFHLDLEDYLIGLLQLASELASHMLCVL